MTTPLQELIQQLEPGQSCICFNLRKSARAITQLYEEALRPIGLRATQFSLLVATQLIGMAPISRLARELVMDRTTLTRNLKPLEKQRLIRVSPGQDDRREREVMLTVLGQEILAKAFPLWEKAQQQVTEELGRVRVDRLLKDLSATVELVRTG